MSAYAPEEYEQKKLAAALAHPSKSTRDKTRSTLTKYIRGNKLKSLELLRLWKALHQCLWLSDKQAVQLELAGFLSGLLHECVDDEAVLDFFAAFWRILMKEWGSLDQFRVNKFYSLMRLMMREAFTLLAGRSWPEDLSVELMEIVETVVLYEPPNGPRYHLADIMLSELHSVTEGDCSHEIVELVMSPFFQLIATSGDPVLRDRMSQAVFYKYLHVHAQELQPEKKQSKRRKTVEESEEDEGNTLSVFRRASTQLLQKTLFELASSTEHTFAKNNRKALYELHSAFQAVTGVQYVEGEGDLVTLEKGNGKGTLTTKKGKGKEKEKEKERKPSEKRKADKITGAGGSEVKKDGESPEKSKKQKKKQAVDNDDAEDSKSLSPSPNSKGQSEGGKASTPEKAASPSFIKAKRFQGFKQGYVFKNDGKGNIGYHLDPKQSLSPASTSPSLISSADKSKNKDKSKGKSNDKSKRGGGGGGGDGGAGSPDKGDRRVSFGKNRSKSHSESVKGLKESAPPSPAVSSRTRKGVLKRKL